MEDKSLEDTARSVIAPESNNVEVTNEGAITERKKVELDNMESLGPVMGPTNSNRNEIIEGNGYMAQEIIVAETQTQKNGVHPSVDSRELSAAKSRFLSESANEALDGGRGESSFWEGFGSDSGPIADWMTRYERTKKKKKKQGKKKSRLCLSVYKESPIVEADGMKTNRKGRSNLKKKLGEEIPKFIPNSSKPVAGESISDSAIANCNRGADVKSRTRLATEIWKFAQEVGAVAIGNDKEIINQIEQMETRDSTARRQRLEKDAAGGGKVSRILS
ncbi:hypothetical protein SLA2020_229180 [Shorea laevis]